MCPATARGAGLIFFEFIVVMREIETFKFRNNECFDNL